jgi:hypothetical protein
MKRFIVAIVAVIFMATGAIAAEVTRANIKLVHSVDLTNPELNMDKLFFRGEFKGELNNGLGTALGFEYDPQGSIENTDLLIGVTYHKSIFEAEVRTFIKANDFSSIGQRSEVTAGIGTKF